MERYKKKVRGFRSRGSRYSDEYKQSPEGTSRKGNINTTMAPSASAGSSDSGATRGHPKHLKGKEIGLYYARRNREFCQPDAPLRPIGEVLLPEQMKEEIRNLLANMTDFYTNTAKTSHVDNAYANIEDSEFKEQFLRIINGTLEEKLNDPSLCPAIKRNADLDLKYKLELIEKQETNRKYIRMLESRKSLPSYNIQNEIINLIKKNQVVVISGETGCGKTTQVAQFILDDYLTNENGSVCRIVCTQPRRISAISVAERVADERGEDCGASSVGFQIRLEKKLPRSSGSIVFCTTGVLLKLMESDPFLSNVSHLILDEIHERDIISDFVITIIKKVLSKRLDLKLILMSATLNSEQFSKYYNDCPMVNIPGFTFPVTCYYLEDALSVTKYELPKFVERNDWRKHLQSVKRKKRERSEFMELLEPYVQSLRSIKKYTNAVCNTLLNPNSEKLDPRLVLELLIYICRQKDDGSILIFLPGLLDIMSLCREMKHTGRFPPYRYIIIPLHSKMPSTEQRQIFEKPPPGKRKIVIATNIAETSITIDDIVYVIDCGKLKMKTYDVENDLESLNPEWVSTANANQRKGRAGRVQAGVCYHLFSKVRLHQLESYQLPEVKRSRLENIVLTVKILQLGKADDFLNKLMDPPDPKATENAIKLLKHMDALDNEERLTPLGYHLAKLPVNPRMGKMILLGALFSCLDPILSIAASLDFKDAFQIPMEKERQVNERKRELLSGWKSDHLILAQAINRYEHAKTMNKHKDFCWYYFLSSHTLELLCNMKEQFVEYLYDMKFISNKDMKASEWNMNSKNLSLVKALVCASLYPNIAVIKKISKKRKVLHTLTKENVQLHFGSINLDEEYFESPLLVYHLKMKSTAIFLHDTTMVHPLPVLFFGDEIIIDSHDEENNTSVISLCEMLRFKCKYDTAILIKKLKAKLNNLLRYKIAHPGIVDWTAQNTEKRVLSAIMELITSEDMGQMYYEYDTD